MWKTTHLSSAHSLQWSVTHNRLSWLKLFLQQHDQSAMGAHVWWVEHISTAFCCGFNNCGELKFKIWIHWGGLTLWHCDINEARYVFSRTMHHCHRNCQTLRFMARDCIGQNNWKLGNTSILFPFLFLFIQVSLEISTMPTPSKATKRTSPFSPVNIPRDPFFKSWDLFHTSITLQPCIRCRTVALGQHMLLEQSFSNDASKANNSPGNASSSRLFDNCTGTFRKKICIATCCKASGKTLSKDERYC